MAAARGPTLEPIERLSQRALLVARGERERGLVQALDLAPPLRGLESPSPVIDNLYGTATNSAGNWSRTPARQRQ